MKKNDQEINNLIDQAVSGDKNSLEELLGKIHNNVFNLSLRMLGMIPDAEDATQDILIRIMTNLSTFRKESSFHTWVYRISANYLINYKKSMFAQHPLDFEIYGNDIRYAKTDEIEDLVDELSREILAEELKMCCTNVMLQCLDSESRCIFILGTMFKIDSRTAAEILDITPENYRQRLSRIRKKVAEFLAYHCGLTETGICSCKKRVNYAILQKRIDPKNPKFLKLKKLDKKVTDDFKNEMEKLDELSSTFENMPDYKSPVTAQKIIQILIESAPFKKIQEIKEEV